jgi:alkyl hydroperoxide reductase subunit F
VAKVTDPVCRMKVDENSPFAVKVDHRVFHFCSEHCRDEFLAGGDRMSRCYDLIIIGGGPAGITAGVYASLLKLDALVLSRDIGGQAIDSSKIENYMGFDYIGGPELAGRFKHQLLAGQLDHRIADVTQVSVEASRFVATTAETARFTARSLIVATGMVRRRLNVPGEERLQRRGIFYGHIQDFAFAHDLDVAVIGGGNSALQIVENLIDEARTVHLVTHGGVTGDRRVAERALANPGVDQHRDSEVLEITGDTRVEGLVIRNRKTGETERLAARAVFVAVGLVTSSELVAHLVKLNRHKEITIGPDCSTSHPGIFAAGDVTNSYGKRIIIAAGEGAKAALAVRQYLRGLERGTAPAPPGEGHR